MPAAPAACRRRARGLRGRGRGWQCGAAGRWREARGTGAGVGWREKEEEEVWTSEPTSAAVTWVAGDIARRAGAGLQSPDPGQPI